MVATAISWFVTLWRRLGALLRRAPTPVAPLRPSAVPPVPRDIYLVAPGSLAALLRPALEARERAEAAANAAGEVLPYGDFRDPAEFDHFAALPPIEPDDLAAVDWDALARDLTR